MIVAAQNPQLIKTLIVSDRGQVTLPKRLRDRLGIAPGSALIAEEAPG